MADRATDDIIPIRDGVVPALDLEREMIDYFQQQLREYRGEVGQPPTRIALVLMGNDEDGSFCAHANSWDIHEKAGRAENCGTAAALLLKRAMSK